MLRAMFGMGGSEILVILIVALLFLGPDKLPDAATKISKGIRELRRQTREVQQTIENDTEIGGAIRDLKSALRGDEIRPKMREALAPLANAAKELNDAARLDAPVKPATAATPGTPTDTAPAPDASATATAPSTSPSPDAPALEAAAAPADDHAAAAREYAAALDRKLAAEDAAKADAIAAPARPAVTLPPSAGEPHDPDLAEPDDDAELAKLIRPAAGTIAHGTAKKSADGHG